MFGILGLLSSCEKNLDEEAITTHAKVDYESKIVDISSVPEIKSLLVQIGDPVYKTNSTSKTTNKETPKVIFDKTTAIVVTDKDKNKKYTFRFTFDNTPENVFYNLVVTISTAGEKTFTVLKYTCNTANFMEFKNHKYNFYYFQGTMAIHKFTDFFNSTKLVSKSTTETLCPPQYDQYGDPLPIVTVTVSGSSSGGGSTSSGDGGTGSGTTSGTGGSIGGGCSIITYTSSCWCDQNFHGDLVGAHDHTQTVIYFDIQCFPVQLITGKSLTDCPPVVIPSGLVGGVYTTTPTKLDILKTDLALTGERWRWVRERTEVANSLFDYLHLNDKSVDAFAFDNWAINYLMTHPDVNFEMLLNSRTTFDTNSGDADNNDLGGYDNTFYSDFNPQQASWSIISSVIPINQFVGFGTPGIRRNCMDYAKAQIKKKGYKISNYGDLGQTFKIYREQTGVNQVELLKGLSYLKYALSNGIPVIVGVDDASGVPLNSDGTPGNPDLTTDHFIVIVGMGTNSHGNYFQFYDNASGYPSQGTNPANLLYYNSNTGVISGQSQTTYAQTPGLHNYIITQIRKSKL